MWYSPIAVSTVVIVGLIVSYLTQPLKPNEIDSKLIIPIDRVCCCCLPKNVRHWFRRGTDHENEPNVKKPFLPVKTEISI